MEEDEDLVPYQVQLNFKKIHQVNFLTSDLFFDFLQWI